MAYMRVQRQDSISKLINDLLYHDSSKAMLIICSTKKFFLQQLIASISARQGHGNVFRIGPDLQQSDDVLDVPIELSNEPSLLLNQTIGLIARSRKIKALFCPSVDIIRAVLATLPIRYINDFPLQSHPSENDKRGSIVIIDLVALHYPTPEFSAQGLSRTFAIAIEAAAKMNAELLLCECGDAVDNQNVERGSRLWDLHAPLLSGPSRNTDGQSNWTGRHTSVKAIAQRWFVFDEGEDRNALNDKRREE
jgi:hypothetical protein